MAGTRRYWDGEDWTDHIAPVEVAQAPAPKPTSVLTVARGVALGILIAIAAVAIWVNLASANDGVECATRNVERAMGERAGPMEICPD